MEVVDIITIIYGILLLIIICLCEICWILEEILFGIFFGLFLIKMDTIKEKFRKVREENES